MCVCVCVFYVCSMPVFSLIFGRTINAFHQPNTDKAMDDVNVYAFYFLGLAGISFILNFVQVCFTSTYIVDMSLSSFILKLAAYLFVEKKYTWGV